MSDAILPAHIDSLIAKAPDYLQKSLFHCAYDLADIPGMAIAYPPDADTYLYVGSYLEPLNQLTETFEPSFMLGMASPFAPVPENCYRPLIPSS